MRVVLVLALAVFAAALGVGDAGSRASAWCGTGETGADRLPDAAAGPQIHVIYAIPSDGDDHFAQDAPLIVADLEAVDAWWQREDPTRLPRFDLFAFPGCAGGPAALDLSSVRLAHDTAYYQPIDGRSRKLSLDLQDAFFHPWKKQLVYYDAPVDTPFDCGQSEIAADANASSFVYLQADGCTHDLGAGGGTAGYAAHELLHNLGAVPDGAPHLCFEHAVCDWYWDIETQFPTGDPIAKLVLDYGRDDYYGHAGAWFDVQDSPWLSHVGTPREQLVVSLAGTGRGSVASDLPGLACPDTCSVAWEQGTNVVLRATAATGSRFLGWSGPCTGAGECGVIVDKPEQVRATFAPAVVRLAVAIRGRGTVTSSPPGIACPGRCSARFDSGTTVRLRAKPRVGWRLTSCACRPYADRDRRVAVVFRKAVRRPAAVGGSNPIQLENARRGTPGWGDGNWQDSAIQGYASETSVAPGETLHLHVSTPPRVDYRVEFFRLGWYGGAGGRLVGCLPSCNGYESGGAYGPADPDPATGEVRLSWPVTDTLAIPADWVSGYYLARLVPSDDSARGTVPFVVREAASRRSSILVEVPVNTWQAYNAWGGKSLYDFNSSGGVPASRVSFDRPYLWEVPGSQPVSKWELPVVRYLEREGDDVSYATDSDVDADPGILLRHRAVIVVGHGEYWTTGMRDAFEAAREAGTNLAFLGANIGYWQVRYENGGRTMVGHKTAPDLFRNLSPPRPECELLGVQHYTGSYDWPRADFAVGDASDPWFAGTGLTAGSVVVGVVSREHDQIPAGSSAGTSCGLDVTVLFRHEGGIDLERAESVRYEAPSGARVFSAGSLEFGWALDAYRVNGDGAETPVDPRIQQFVEAMLADLQRPAPPARVTARRLKRSTQVVVGWSDPRIAGSILYRRRGSSPFTPADPGARQVYAGPGRTFLDRARLAPGLYRYAAVVLDEWGRSQARLSGPVRVPRRVKARR